MLPIGYKCIGNRSVTQIYFSCFYKTVSFSYLRDKNLCNQNHLAGIFFTSIRGTIFDEFIKTLNHDSSYFRSNAE